MNITVLACEAHFRGYKRRLVPTNKKWFTSCKNVPTMVGQNNIHYMKCEATAWEVNQRFHFEGNFLLKGIFCKMKEI
jgi:hypothetical protein